MNRAEFDHVIRARANPPSIGTGQSRAQDKRALSAEIELLTMDFLANGGEIEQLPSQERSDFKPTWSQFKTMAFDGVDGAGEAA